MKHLVTIAFISTYLFSFGQSPISEMYWNNYSNFNPAMSGFQYDRNASATYTNFYPSLSGTYTDIFANYDMKIADNHGIGINYTRSFSFIESNRVFLNYNYQFHLKKAGKLSVGTGLGIQHLKMTDQHFLYNDSIAQQFNPESSFQFNLGFAYNWKNLHFGISIIGLPDAMIKVKYVESYPFAYAERGNVNIHAQYAFQISNKFQLTPRVVYSSQNGFQRLQPNLTLSYNQRFHLGVSSELRDNFGVNVGWDILNKFRVAYMFSKTISKLSNGVSGGVHEFSIGYILKNKPVTCDVGEKPKH